MSIIAPSPNCLVNTLTTENGVDVTASTLVTIQLADTAGVSQWNISCISTDDFNLAATINTGLSIDLVTKTATFTAPATPIDGSALIFQSKVNNGIDPNGVRQSSYVTTFKIAVLTSTGLRIFAFDEAIENNATFGWIPTLNYMIRNYGTGTGLLAGAGLFVGGGAYNVGQNADGSIVVNANDIQLKPAYSTLLNSATSNADPNSLALRNGSGDITFNNIVTNDIVAFGNISSAGTTFTATLSASTFTILTQNVLGSTNSSSITGQTGSVVNGTSGTFIFATGLASGSGTSGPLLVRTGNSVTGSSGQAFLQSGQVTSGSGGSGSVNLVTGSVVAGASGDINMTTGTNSGGTSGNINMKSNGSGVSIGQIGGSFGGGKNVIFIANATTIPNANPTGGGVLYVQSGALKYRGSSGTVTPIAPA